MVYNILLFISAMLTNENEGQMSNGKSSESGDVHVSVAANENGLRDVVICFSYADQ